MLKLLIVTCLHEFQSDVAKLFGLANIAVFSSTPITGFRNSQAIDIMDSWFASGVEKMDSVLLFSFTTAENAACAMQLIKDYNKETAANFPVHSFILAVEKPEI